MLTLSLTSKLYGPDIAVVGDAEAPPVANEEFDPETGLNVIDSETGVKVIDNS